MNLTRASIGNSRVINSLTGRLLVLTITFVMLAEVLILLPSISRFRQEYLQERFRAEDRMIRLLGKPEGGAKLEVTLLEKPLRDAIVDFTIRIIWLSLLISAITAGLLFFTVRSLIVKPIRGVVDSMVAYQENPEDARRIIEPKAGVVELRAAETALNEMQSELTKNLRQKERLASLGVAVSKVGHDLRNMLTTVQLLADRMENSQDPTVQRVAPKLIGSVNRAITLCEQTLKFGKAEEKAPQLAPTQLSAIVQDIKDAELLREEAVGIDLVTDFEGDFEIYADSEQMFRAINNLVRNARQAIATSGKGGTITVRALATAKDKQIEISDTGPGLPKKARDKLFTPFHGGARRGGSGLGLAIAAELVRGHGGELDLVDTSDFGTRFRISLPHHEITSK